MHTAYTRPMCHSLFTRYVRDIDSSTLVATHEKRFKIIFDIFNTKYTGLLSQMSVKNSIKNFNFLIRKFKSFMLKC